MRQRRPYSCCHFAPQPFQERHQAFWCGATTQRRFSALPATEMASPATPLSHAIGAQTTAVCAAAAPMGQHHLPLETQRASPVARILPRESPSRTSHRGLQLHRPRTKYPPRFYCKLRCTRCGARRRGRAASAHGAAHQRADHRLDAARAIASNVRLAAILFDVPEPLSVQHAFGERSPSTM